MIFSKWRNWVYILLGIHIGSLIANAVAYGIITFTMDVPFLTIFEYPQTAPYYLITYAFVLVFTLTLCSLGLIFGDIFGHKDLRAQLVSRGLNLIGILGSLLPLTLITMWDLSLNQPMQNWSNLVIAVQHFAIWIALITTASYACIMLLIFFLGREYSFIPNGWAQLSLMLACVGFLMALSCFFIAQFVILFRIIYLVGSIGYLVWVIWLATLIKKVERMH